MKINEKDVLSLLKNDYLEVWLGEPAGMVIARWLQHPSSVELRSNCYLLAELLLECESRWLLHDTRAILYLELADQHWLMEELIPLLSATALELQACVVSQISLELMDTDRLVTHFSKYAGSTRKAIETRLFLDTAQAREWLM